MPCITLSSGKTVCFEDNKYPDGGGVDLKLNKVKPVEDEKDVSLDGGFHGNLFNTVGAHGSLNYGPLRASGNIDFSGYDPKNYNPSLHSNLRTNVQVNPRLNVNANLQYDYNKESGSKFNPSFGANYQVNPNLNVGVQYNSGSPSFSISKKFPDGGKTLQVKGSSFNIPKSQQQILAEQARMQGDMPIAKPIVNQQQRIREEEALKKKLANQPTVRLSEAQKKDISAQGLKEDVLAEQMMRNKQSLSNPDEGSYMDVLGNSVLKQIGFNPDVLYSAAEDIEDNGLLGLGNAMLSYPTGVISGRYETPSQAIGRFALKNDANQLRNAMIDDQGNPTGLGMATDIFGPMALGHVLPKGADLAVKTLGTEEGLLSNAYKINPSALKENPEMFLYRARPVGQNVDMNMAAQMRAKQAAGEPLTWYQKNLLNPQTNPQLLAREKYYGQWFEKDPSRLDFYIQSGTRNFADDDVIEILRTRLPKKEAAKFNVSQFNDAKVLSASPETEFILPKDMITSAERFPESSWQQLIKEDKAFNKPHWWKGFKKEGGGKNTKTITLSTGKVVTLK